MKVDIQMPDSLPDEDQQRIDAILSFWFKEQTLSAPQIDQRMDTWFGVNAAFDHEVQTEFSVDIDNASAGLLNHWASDPRGSLALILLIDQFRRNVYR
ncbi:MAG: DUF924 family protein, partial [Proteobacteria bacterium]|nr:DUF924 family protein [Pseudomonadota bacterium]